MSASRTLAGVKWLRPSLPNTEKTDLLCAVLETNRLKVNLVVVEAMKEVGIDISNNKPKLLTAKLALDADLIVTMGCNDQGICPGSFFKPTIDWKLEDPKGKSIEKV